MKRRIILAFAIVILLTAAAATTALAGRNRMADLRRATAEFHRTEAAIAAGYNLVPGLDHCFNNPGVGAMGYHYINTDILDTEVERLKPEAMVYAPGPKGKLQLGAVEYIVPAEAWDNEGNTQPPELYGRHFHLNQDLGVYVLHVWIWMDNPAGLFEDWNPTVTCQ